jgi:hypothetical protein
MEKRWNLGRKSREWTGLCKRNERRKFPRIPRIQIGSFMVCRIYWVTAAVGSWFVKVFQFGIIIVCAQ